MALAPRGKGSGWFLTCRIIDTQGDSSTLKYALQSADYATAVTDSTAVISALDSMTAAVIGSTSLSFVQDEDTFAFPNGADCGVRARLTFQIANSVKKATLDIPAPENDIFVGGQGPTNNVVDSTDPAVGAYAQLFQAGGNAFISDGELSDFFLSGKRTTR